MAARPIVGFPPLFRLREFPKNMTFRKNDAVLSRRGFLKSMAGLIALAGLGRSVFGAVKPKPVGPKAEPGTFRQALAEALQGQSWMESGEIMLEVPQLAENGAIVPITVESRLPNTERILIFAEKNPVPLLAQFRFAPGADGWVSLRIKLNETGPVMAVAESGGKFYGTEKRVKVMVGGCG
jgi:sulfur-oxidizing protein SoxY